MKTAFTRSRGYTLKNLAATLAVGTLLGGTTAGYFLGGFSTCPAVPTVTGTTASPVSGVSTKLASCRTELSRAQQNTKQCQGDLSRCETKADTYVGQLTDARASLAQRDREVSQYKSDLRTSNAGWDETNRSMSDYVWKLTQCEDKVRGTLGELEESTDNESRNYGSLSDCQARLLTQGENTEKTDESLMAGRDTATRNTDTTKMRYQSQTSGKKTGTQSTQTTKRPKERSTGGRSTATRTTKVSEPTLTMGRSTAAQKTGRVQDTQPSRGLLNKSYKDLMDEGTDETDDQIWDRFARILGGL